MTVYYAQHSDISSFLGCPAFSGSTAPTSTFVETLIAGSESKIDAFTGQSWRGTRVIKYLDPVAYLDGWTIFYAHDLNLLTLAALSSDSFKVWSGSSYVEWLGVKTESRAGDYWIDYYEGRIHIKGNYYDNDKPLLISYRVGSSSAVPEAIKLACIKLTAASVIQQDDRSVILPEGTSNIPLVDKATRWRKEAYEILSCFQMMNVY